MNNQPPEKEIELKSIGIGNNNLGQFEYFIHKVEYSGIEQFRLRLKLNGKFKVIFCRNLSDLKGRIKPLMKELLA